MNVKKKIRLLLMKAGTSSYEEDSPQAEVLKLIGDSKHRCGHLEAHHKVSKKQIIYYITSCNSDRGITTKQSICSQCPKSQLMSRMQKPKPYKVKQLKTINRCSGKRM